MRNFRGTRGFGTGLSVGLLAGLLIGSATVAVAAFGKTGWRSFKPDFKVGYVTGFLDMANLARNLDPGGWVDQRYPWLPKAKPPDYCEAINTLWNDPENDKYSILSILQAASYKLEDKFGKAPDPRTRVQQRMNEVLAEFARKRAASEGQTLDPNAPKPTVSLEPIKPRPVNKKVSAADDDETEGKKWCRCDGIDPKAARAARRAAAGKPAEEAQPAATTRGEKRPPVVVPAK